MCRILKPVLPRAGHQLRLTTSRRFASSSTQVIVSMLEWDGKNMGDKLRHDHGI